MFGLLFTSILAMIVLSIAIQTFVYTMNHISDKVFGTKYNKTYDYTPVRKVRFAEDQIKTYMDALNYVAESSSNTNKTNSSVSLLDSANIYNVSDLNKSGTYEIVFRTPPSNSLFASGDEEIKFPISFSGYK